MKNFKAAIFDLDGTLIDSMGIWEKIDVDFFAKRGLDAPATYIQDIAHLTFTQTAEYTAKLLGGREKAEDLLAEWFDMARHEYAHNLRLKPHAEEYLKKLKSLGVKISLATTNGEELAVPALKNNGVEELFDAKCYIAEVTHGKAHPDIYLLAAKKLGVEPSDCIVFEDILPAVQGAKKAGMKVVAVYDEYADNKKEIEAAADLYLHSYKNAPLP